MSPRATSLFACQSCGASSPKWLGRCPECGEWNSYVEEASTTAAPVSVGPGEARARCLPEIEARAEDRVATGLPGLDRVLGGGLVAGSVVLVGGEPGIGKSTLLLQAARGVAGATASGGWGLYASGEGSAPPIRLRSARVGLVGGAGAGGTPVVAG